MQEPFHFQKATLSNVEQLYVLEKLCFGEEGFSKRQLSYLISKSKGEVVCLKFSKEIIAALILLYRKGSHHIRIYSIAVSPEMRGKGLAKQMILLSEKKAKEMGLEKLSLEVNENNQSAIQLYISIGFQITKTKKDYYKDGSSAIIMKKYLS